MKYSFRHLYIFLFSIVGFACTPEGDHSPMEPKLRNLQANEVETVEGSSKFAVNLFQQLRKGNHSNQFYSPYSIHLALSMAMNGNKREGLGEFKEILRLEGQTLEEANRGAKALTEFLLQVDPKVKMSIANAIWYRDDYQVKVPFITAAKEFYHAEVSGIDVFDPGSVHIVNKWIEKQTQGHIQDMLDKIPADAVMYLVNAIYFKADWTYQFDPQKTKKEPFHVTSTQQVEVDMMGMEKPGSIKTYASGNYQYLEIPYSTGQYSMGILLPSGHDFQAIEEELTAKNLAFWRNQATEKNILLKMPKFILKHKMENMEDDLIAMGLQIPFEFDRRNFTEIFDNPTDLLKISRVIHDAIIEVDEKGSEAAAATVVEGVELTSMPSGPQTITLDRPFLFFIQEKHSGAILFMGKLVDPSLL